MPKPIYVEIEINAPLDELWRFTQTPELHETWDLRFTSIEEIDSGDEGDARRFDYATRIGFGLSVRGQGEYLAVKHRPNGERSSSLRFWSESPLAIIREGSGYWRYHPLDAKLAHSPVQTQPIRFATGYSYQPRWGVLGRVIDGCIFRPLMGWATAWSFDALRIKLERGTDPRTSLALALAYTVARIALAFTFAWHGVVPKLVARDGDEIAMLQASGVDPADISSALLVVGIAEVVAALIVLALWRKRWPLIVSIIGMLFALTHVAFASPEYLSKAFNPVSLNLIVVALALIALVLHKHIPSASKCRRTPRATQPKEGAA